MEYREIKPGKKYKHFKGNEYEVLNIATHSENLEKYIVYRALYGDPGVWVRPYDLFADKIESDGKIFYRFEEVPDNDFVLLS